MAVTYGFYNSVNGDRKYNAEQFGAIFEGIITDGIFPSVGNKLLVSAYSGMQISVASGRAWFKNTWTNNDGPIYLTVPAPEAALNRYDAVVVEVQNGTSARQNAIKIIKGTPSANPTKPTGTRSGNVWQYPIAYILVNAGTTAITASMITDNRGQSNCPYVSVVSEAISGDYLPKTGGTISGNLAVSGNLSTGSGKNTTLNGPIFGKSGQNYVTENNIPSAVGVPAGRILFVLTDEYL